MIGFEIEPEKQPEESDFLTFLEERDRAITACAARPSGHAWQIEGEPGENPALSCADCPAIGDDSYPDVHHVLEFEDPVQSIGGREVRWGVPLADDAEPYTVPVSIEIEEFTRMTDYGTEYDAVVRLAPRGGEEA